MAKFIVAHGSLITGKTAAQIGDAVELSPEEKAHLDPDGNKFVTPEVFDAMQKKTSAQAVIDTSSKPKASKPAPPPPAPTPKGGTK